MTAPLRPQSPLCVVNTVSSRICELGTKSCPVKHSEWNDTGVGAVRPQSAEQWLARQGLADLSLYWPTNKPLPQVDYISGEARPTLIELLEAYARAAAPQNHKWEPDFSNGEPSNDSKICGICGKEHD